MAKNNILAKTIGTGFGSGYWPWGPGTAGALLATVIWWLLGYVLSACWLTVFTSVLCVVFYVAGVWAANRLEPEWGEDPSRVVVDEMVGVWIPLLVAPPLSWLYAVAAFLLFRFFDILKPLGIRRMEALGGGTGVMMDDVLAGVYSAILLALARLISA